ncbi:Telomerase Protein Component 1 [Manis pentadactyla]|nr:Telomerase Protein Component 1 [Manis pentadactyla]
MHMLRLRREFGFNSDTLALLNSFMVSCDGERKMVRVSCKGKSMHMIQFRRELGFSSDTLALRKGLGSGSDVKRSARWWIRVMLNSPGLGLRFAARRNSMRMIWLWRELGFSSDVMGEYAIQFKDNSEARLISMVMVEFQATGPRYG